MLHVFFVHHHLAPQVFVLSGVIAMVTCAVFLRLNSLLKLAVLLLAMIVYSYLIHLAFLTLTRHDALHRSEPGALGALFNLYIAVTMFCLSLEKTQHINLECPVCKIWQID